MDKKHSGVTVGCLALLLLASACRAQEAVKLEPIKVEIRNEAGRFQLYRGGRHYLIKGAVYVGDQDGRFPLKDLADRGANSIRAGANTRTLDEAHRLGLDTIFHSCGNVEEIIPELIDIGLDVLNPLQPGAMDLERVARNFGGRYRAMVHAGAQAMVSSSRAALQSSGSRFARFSRRFRSCWSAQPLRVAIGTGGSGIARFSACQ